MGRTDDRCQLPISRLLSHGSCDAEPKVARVSCVCVSLSLRAPPPSPSLLEPPAVRKDPLPRLEWLLLGLLSRWRGREEGGGYTDLENTVNSPQPPPSTLHPILLSSVPTYPPPPIDRQSSCCMCMCTCHLSPYGLLWWMHVSERDRDCVCFHTHVDGFLVGVCGCVSE